jgi:hypothetical protein
VTVLGFNPMRWCCEERGCYNVKQRPKIEIFAQDLPGRIACTDIDMTVEVNGHFLFVEFKGGGPRPLPVGQRIYFERLTALHPRIVAVAACADAETMAISHIALIANGRVREWERANIDILHTRIRRWAALAQTLSGAAA